MNKKELVEKIVNVTGESKAATENTLNTFMKVVESTIKKENITLVGFGTFSKVRRKARTGVNPQTGEKMKIKARNVAKFKPSKTLNAKL